jgi:pimeloyl-ACP methyl ester carboxylesterase
MAGKSSAPVYGTGSCLFCFFFSFFLTKLIPPLGLPRCPFHSKYCPTASSPSYHPHAHTPHRPGSFIEVTKILSQLVNGPSEFPSFHVVAPSLVDFAFSSGCPKKAFSIDQHAEYCHKLMLSLNYPHYIVQGGDLGSFIARMLVSKYPTACVAMHTNFALPAEPTAATFPALAAKAAITPLTDAEKAGLARTEWYNKVGNGYMIEHSTKPQTIGYSMIDSPVGLLAWIYEKLHDWTDDYAWTPDEILTWISIYYFSKAGPHATQRIYYAFAHGDALNGERPVLERIRDISPPSVKIGVTRFPRELLLLPKGWVGTMGDVVFERECEWGSYMPISRVSLRSFVVMSRIGLLPLIF